MCSSIAEASCLKEIALRVRTVVEQYPDSLNHWRHMVREWRDERASELPARPLEIESLLVDPRLSTAFALLAAAHDCHCESVGGSELIDPWQGEDAESRMRGIPYHVLMARVADLTEGDTGRLHDLLQRVTATLAAKTGQCSHERAEGEQLANERVRTIIKAALQAVGDPIAELRVSVPQEQTSSQGDATQIDWQHIQQQLEDCRLRGEQFTSRRRLAKRFRCSPSTVHKALDSGTVELQEWAKKQRGPSRLIASPKVSSIALKTSPQHGEPVPGESLEQADVDVMLARLLDEAEPDERARIHAMTPEQKRRLAEVAYRDPDLEEQVMRYRRARCSR